MVNLSRAAAGLAPFRPDDALELIRYAVRRGLIGSDEGDRVTAEISGAAQAKAAKAATRKAAREERKRVAGKKGHGHKPGAPKRHGPPRARAKHVARPRKAAARSKRRH